MHDHQLRGSGRTDGAVKSESLYTRPMPGGGCVRVELAVSEPGDIANERLRGRVVLEKRAGAPAPADEPVVVVVELEGDDPNVVVAELFRIARDNAAIARHVLRPRSVTRAD